MDNLEIDYLANQPQFTGQIAELWCKEWSDKYNKNAIIRKTKSLKKASNINSIPLILVAYSENELLGTGAIFNNDLTERINLSPWLGGIYILEKYRGKGVATKIIKQVELEALRLGYTKLYLHTETAAELYQKLGWEFIEELKIKNGITSKIFSKTIK